MFSSFEQEIENILSCELSSSSSYKYIVYGGKAVVIEGHKGIVKFCSDRMEFRVSEGRLCVLGVGLTLRQMAGGVAILIGRVNSVSVERNV